MRPLSRRAFVVATRTVCSSLRASAQFSACPLCVDWSYRNRAEAAHLYLQPRRSLSGSGGGGGGGMNESPGELRTRMCGEVCEGDVGSEQRLAGWVKFSRLGGKEGAGGGFLVLSDHTGDMQVLVSRETDKGGWELAWSKLGLQSCIAVSGVVCLRPDKDMNRKMRTGRLELRAEKVLFFNPSDPPPFSLSKAGSSLAKEELRLQFRYLDLRRPDMQHMLRVRSRLLHRVRRDLVERHGFTDVETPTLFRPTPGGAKEFLVRPSGAGGRSFALTQSPQLMKQLLMVAGVDRYFQIARCYRDENQMSDRQAEFTQLDLELSFSSRSAIQRLVEAIVVASWKEVFPNGPAPPDTPFPSSTYLQVMRSYGSDKPDLRFANMKLEDLSSSLPVELPSGHRAVGLRVPAAAAALSNSFLRTLESGVASELGLQFHGWSISQSSISSNKFHSLSATSSSLPLGKDNIVEINSSLGAGEGDRVYVCSGPDLQACSLLGRLRTRLIQALIPIYDSYRAHASEFSFSWVEDFPLFVEDASGGWEACHHPFTRPNTEDMNLLESDPGSVRSQHFDLVLNGAEIGGGSVRIHEAELQRRVLRLLRLEESQFGYLLDALALGAPPHGGIALGVDRYLAVLLGKPTIRDVIAFPKTSQGNCLMSGAPALVDTTA